MTVMNVIERKGLVYLFVDSNGNLSEKSLQVLSEFIASNAGILKKLIDKDD